jgi:prophage DNA circulation protein
MNIDVYKKLNDGPLVMKCPGLDEAKQTQNGINDVISKLRSLGLDPTNGVNIALITQIEEKLNLSISAMDRNMGYMQSLADDAIWLSSKTNLISTLDDMAGLPVSSCVNTDALFAPLTGGANALYDAASQLSQRIMQKIDDFLSGASDLVDFEAFLNTLSGLIDSSIATFDSMVSEGKAMISAFEAKIMNSSVASAIGSVWDNPCTQAILETILPDDIKDLL